MRSNFVRCAVAIVICELAGLLGSLFTMPSIPTWYTGITKPAFTPPNWLFGPVWTTLFALMGVAAFLVWKMGWQRRDVKIALGIFTGQLILNVLWSAVFFGLHALGWSVIVIHVLWLAILTTIIAFGRISRKAAWLLVPYLAWVTFAGILNATIWRIN